VSEATAQPDDPRLAVALRLAEEAGRRALARRGRAAVSWKSPGERVTDTDVANQLWLVEEVRSHFPGDGILAEEGERTMGADREFVWIVDPLDGTNNYALGIPCFALSLGILRCGQPYAGVVLDPNTGWTGRALVGHGAFAEAQRLAVESRPLGPASNVSVCVPVDPDIEPLVAAWLRLHKFRGFGSVALHLGYAALGAIDVILDHKAALWDLTGGAVVLLEAGGRITDPAGRPLFPFDVGAYCGGPVAFLASNPQAHEAALADCRALATTVANREW
jgi:myo-inositol-1(or 4)-monophosphatase